MIEAEHVSEPLSVRVQTVLYDTTETELRRFLIGLSAACDFAKHVGAVSRLDLIIGDCSTPPTTGWRDSLQNEVPGSFDVIDYEAFHENLGPGGGHNTLFKETSDAVLIIEPDTYPSPRLIAELISGIADRRVGIVEGRQLPIENPKQYDPVSLDTSWASATCMLVRSSAFAEIGGFEPRLFFLHAYDIDFSWRIRLGGWRVIHHPLARVVHDKRLSAQGEVVENHVPRSLHEATVLLAWRYGVPDIALDHLERLAESSDPTLRELAAELRQRLTDGDIPQTLDGGNEVASFEALALKA